MKELNIGGVPEHFNLPWRLAIEDNAFASIGVQCNWFDMHGGTGQMIKELEKGSLDMAVLLTEGIVLAILNGLQAKITGIYVDTPLRWGVHVSKKAEKNRDKVIYDKVFAISRQGSGSHLMTYVKALQEKETFLKPKFEVVGSLEGGIKALQENTSQVFLWEKYTTQPFVDQNKCARIDEVLTPWPCFVIAARSELAKSLEIEISAIQHKVAAYALKLKSSSTAKELFATRYDLDQDQVQRWLSETQWNKGGAMDKEPFNTVVEYLLKTNLITQDSTSNWQGKVFIQ